MKAVSIFVLVLLCAAAYGQTEQYDYESPDDYKPIPPARFDIRWLIDSPTAHMLPRGAFGVDVRTFPEAGMQAALSIGLADRFSVGIAYGSEKILSEDTPEWNPMIGFKIRYQLINGKSGFPELALGFSNFGYGLFREKDTEIGYYEDRHLVKSPGFYLVFSKKYPVDLNKLSLHGGVNYSLENGVDSDPSFFVGMATSLSYDLVFIAEYDFAINDNKPSDPVSEPNGIFGRGRGYLNVGISWYLTPELSLELDFKNLLLNRMNREEIGYENKALDREVRLVYLQFFKD